MVKTLFLGFLAFAAPLFATPKLNTIDTYPRSIAKDFYIWYFLQQNISAQKADELFAQTAHINMKLLKAYAKKSHLKELKQALKCQSMPIAQALKKRDLSCLAIALSPFKASKLKSSMRQKIAKKLKKHSPYTAHWLELMNEPFNSKKLKKSPQVFLYLFLRSGKNFRLWHYNKAFDYHFLKKLSHYKAFDRFVELAALSPQMNRLQKALLKLKLSKHYSTHAAFYLALIHIIHHNIKSAKPFLEYVSKKDYFQMNRDKALFWLYLISKQNLYLKKLYYSTDLNIYTLYAAELLKKEPLGIYTPIFLQKSIANYDESNPFYWLRINSNKELEKPEEACKKLPSFKALNTQATYAFLLERCANYALHPFVTPYLDQLDDLDGSKKALFYAIGRQESRLIAGGISSAYAMGIMQIMPFLSKAIAKERKEKFYLPNLFNPKLNIRYAKHHLNYLYRKLKHPLLIAYAYNGGIGFVRRSLKTLFKNGKYEPFLSIERLAYAETREYGKKVLSNYIVYKRLFNEPISIVHLFDTLIQSSHSVHSHR